MDLSDRAFARLVREALALIPAEFRPYLENVSVVIEEEPPDDLLDTLAVPPGDTLFGLYSGTPMTERSHASVELPERITLFRGPLLDACGTLEELRTEIATTVIHEVAHHFGIDEARLEELGWD